MNVDEEHRQFDRRITGLEKQAAEQAAQLRRIQIELDLFIEDQEEVNPDPVNHSH